MDVDAGHVIQTICQCCRFGLVWCAASPVLDPCGVLQLASKRHTSVVRRIVLDLRRERARFDAARLGSAVHSTPCRSPLL